MRGGAPRAGDDASDVGWVAPSELLDLDTSDGLVDILVHWGVLDPPR